MTKSGEFTIWVNKETYWLLTLIPVKNEFDEWCNRCALINSVTGQEIEALNFDSEWLVPIFQTRSMLGMKDLAKKLKEITDKHKIEMIPSSEMPEEKRIKETQKVVKRIIK
jgi:hypothetical protein